jgi:hypothetical protein
VTINVKAPTDVKISKGDNVFVQFPEEHVILFDGKTEFAI